MTVGRDATATGAGPGRSEWFQPWRFAALLGVLLFSCFPQVVLGLETFAYGDYGQFAYPVAFYLRESFWRGELPLWNPYNDCGVPFLAQWNTLALYPLSLFYLLLPLPWSFAMFCLAHVFLAGMGMYFLVHRWTGYRLAAALAGVVFAFNGLTWYGVIWPHLVAALAWMPWVVMTTERAWQAGGRGIVVAALVGAMQMLSGGAEAVVLTWCVTGLMWLSDLRTGCERGVNCEQGRVARIRISARFGAVVLFVAGLAALQLAPFLDLLGHSQRVGSYGSSALSALEAMPLSGWANLLIPVFHSCRNPEGVFFQPEQSWTGSYYFGVSTVALAVLAAWRARSRQVRLLAVVAVSGLVLALGSNGLVYDGVRRIFPAVNFMRFPIKFVILAVFAGPILAAHGLTWFHKVSPENHRRESARLSAVMLGLLLVMAGLVFVAWAFPVAKGESLTVGMNAVVRGIFLLLILGCLGLIGRVRAGREPRMVAPAGANPGNYNEKLERLLQTSVIVVVWFDVFTHAPSLSPTAPSRALEPNAVRRYFGWGDELQNGASRAMLGREALFAALAGGSENPELDVNVRRMTLMLNFNLLDHVSKFDGFYSSELTDYLDLFKQLYFTTNQAIGLKEFLGISHINSPTNALEWVSRTRFLPLVTAGQAPVFAGRQQTLNGVLAESFSPQEVVYLPQEAMDVIRPRTKASAKVQLLQFSAQKMLVGVDAEADTMVVVAQSFYHPWRAYVDGVQTRLWRANFAFQALQVGKGKHEVLLRYEDRSFCRGAAVSVLTGFGCVVFWTRCRGRRAGGGR